MSELKPCPFCGNPEVDVRGARVDVAVGCFKCDAMGPDSHTDAAAIARWNAHSSPAAAAEKLQWIIDLATWDDNGAVAPKDPRLSWESIAHMALDYARAAMLDIRVAECHPK